MTNKKRDYSKLFEQPRPNCGRNPLPDAADKAELEKILLHSPQEYGYDTATWTGVSVRDYIKQRYGVEYKKAQIYIFYTLSASVFKKEKVIFMKWKIVKKELSL